MRTFFNSKLWQDLLQRVGLLETSQGTIPPANDYNTIAYIKAETVYVEGDRIFCLENQIIYIFNSASTAADNNATVLKPTNINAEDPGRWVMEQQIALKNHTHTTYAEKITDPLQTHFLMANAGGQFFESEYAPSSFATAEHEHSEYGSPETMQTILDEIETINETLPNKADKYNVEIGDVGKYAVFNEDGNTVPSDVFVGDLATEINVDVVAGTPNTITLNMESKTQRCFKTDSISSHVTLLLSNTTNMRLLNYNIRVTGTVVVTFGGSLNWRSEANENYDNQAGTFTFTGDVNSLFEISILRTTHAPDDYYKIKFSSEQV